MNLKLRPYRQKYLPQRQNEKLAGHYFRPFEVLERIGTMAYRLKLPPTATIHQVFHVSQLCRVVGSLPVNTTLPSKLTDELELQFVPESLLSIHYGLTDCQEDYKVLIKWVGLLDFEATWEPYHTFHQ